MCGIAGRIDFSSAAEPPSLEQLTRMASTLRHRGPDEFGYYRDANAGLIHARESIIDIEGGHEPLSNEDGTLWIVFNGEVFNYIELRDELARYGHRFRTRSDTEVIVHAYEEWGEECFGRFNGQWAIAIWETRAKRLTLCRDRLGVRPMFIREHENRVWFASEVKAIFSDPAIVPEIDPRGLDQIFTYWGTVAPISIFRGIEEIRPGSLRVYGPDGKKRDRVYWQPSYPAVRGDAPARPNRVSLGEAAQALSDKLMEATKLRMVRSDVPVGSYLSGGLDSSIIAWMGSRACRGEFRTFSIRSRSISWVATVTGLSAVSSSMKSPK